jgi:hypothetical protein
MGASPSRSAKSVTTLSEGKPPRRGCLYTGVYTSAKRCFLVVTFTVQPDRFDRTGTVQAAGSSRPVRLDRTGSTGPVLIAELLDLRHDGGMARWRQQMPVIL